MAQAAVRPVLSLFLLVPALVAVVLLAREAGTPARRELAEVPVWSLHRPADSPTFRDEQGEGKLAATPSLHIARNHQLDAQEDADLAQELKFAHEELTRDRQEAEAKKRKPRSQSRQLPLPVTDSAAPPAIAPARALQTKSQAKATAAGRKVSLDNVGPGKVHVTIYMESQCPACRKYTTTYLKQVLQEVGDIVHLRVVPFGNADATSATDEAVKYNTTALLKPLLEQLESPWSDPTHAPKLKFKCQHGSDECMGNAWESCLMEVAPHHEDFFPVFDCVESRGCAAGMKPPDCVDYPAFVADGYACSDMKRIHHVGRRRKRRRAKIWCRYSSYSS